MKRNQTIKFWRNKSDKLIQESGREVYTMCMVCGGTYSCLHHFYPKSQSTYLRYHWENLIPLCAGCHMAHHNGDPEIHAVVIKVRGEEWFEELQRTRNANRYITGGYTWYRDKYSKLKLLKPYRV